MKDNLKILVRAILAGVMISIGGTIFLVCESKLLGAFLFSIGLYAICAFGLNLYTGKIGYVIVNKKSYLIELFLTLIGNFIGTYILALGMLSSRFGFISDKAKVICDMKINDNLISILILSCLCGILMYIAVNNYKRIGVFATEATVISGKYTEELKKGNSNKTEKHKFYNEYSRFNH